MGLVGSTEEIEPGRSVIIVVTAASGGIVILIVCLSY